MLFRGRGHGERSSLIVSDDCSEACISGRWVGRFPSTAGGVMRALLQREATEREQYICTSFSLISLLGALTVEQCFSDFNVPINPLGISLNCRF